MLNNDLKKYLTKFRIGTCDVIGVNDVEAASFKDSKLSSLKAKQI